MKLKKEIIMSILLISLFLFFSMGAIFRIYRLADDRELKNEYYPKIKNVSYTLYGPKQFINNGNKLKYEDQNYTSRFGIDVSEFQDDIDWKKVKQDGVEFAFLRIGRRGATTNLLYEDECFYDNYKGCVDNNIDVGIYFFSQALTAQEAIEDADYCLLLLEDRKLDLPIILDYEYSTIFGARTNGLTINVATNNAIAFCEEIKKHGYDVMIYTNLQWYNHMYDKYKIKDYDLWFAQYDVDTPTLKTPFSIWQYTDNGVVDGINTNVDLDIMFIRKNDQPE